MKGCSGIPVNRTASRREDWSRPQATFDVEQVDYVVSGDDCPELA